MLYVQVQRKLVVACILCFIFMIIEVVGGYIAKRWVWPHQCTVVV
jgi:Co/Zn/Cd efflux system component